MLCNANRCTTLLPPPPLKEVLKGAVPHLTAPEGSSPSPLLLQNSRREELPSDRTRIHGDVVSPFTGLNTGEYNCTGVLGFSAEDPLSMSGSSDKPSWEGLQSDLPLQAGPPKSSHQLTQGFK